MGNEKTKASHAFVVRGSTDHSDQIIDLIQSLDGAELVYQKHSYNNLYVKEED